MSEGTAHDKTLILPSGRRLGYALFGDPGLRQPFFYFHGFPGSRLEASLIAAKPQSKLLSIIGVDRPGYGLSEHYPNRRLLDFPDDVMALAQHLGLDKFSVVGCSGGAPYALACAHKIPERLHTCAVISGLGPVHDRDSVAAMNFFNRVTLRGARLAPALAVTWVSLLARLFKHQPALMVKWLQLVSPKDDKRILARDEIRRVLTNSFAAGLATQSSWIGEDLRVLCSPWGFALESIKKTVYLWHGSDDDYVPIEMGRSVAQRLPNCQAHEVPGRGHFMVVEMIDEILKTLRAAELVAESGE